MHELCSLYEQLRNWDGVIEIRKIMNEKFASDCQTWLHLGRAYIGKGDLIKAIDIFEKGIEKFPRNYSSSSRSVSYIWQWASAIELSRFYRLPLKLKTFPPLHRSGNISLEAFVDDNDLDGALRTLHMAIEKFPSVHYFWTRFCEVCIAKGDYDPAIEALKRSMESETTIPLQWGLLGQTFMANKDFEEAIKIFQKGNEKFPEVVQFWDTSARYITQPRDYDEAVKTLTKAVEKNPIVDRLWLQLAQVYMAKGDHDQVVKAYETRIEINPANSALQICKLPDAIMHNNVCDYCSPSSFIQGYLHRCTSCNDYDLCNACFTKSPHPHPDHIFLTVPSERWISERHTKEAPLLINI